MKKAVIALAILCIAFIGVMWRNHQAATGQLEGAAKEIGSLSNQLSTAEMKLNHQERMNTSLNSQLTNNAEALAKSASSLAGAQKNINQSQVEIRTARDQAQSAQSDLEAAKAAAAALSTQIEALNAELRAKETDVVKARAHTADAENNRQQLSQQLAQAQTEIDRLNNQLRNPALLRAQLEALEKRLAAAKNPPHDASEMDMLLNLELQPDGTVRIPPPPATVEQREYEAEMRRKLEQSR
jgi:chromosome segregation ATPase